MVLLISNEKKKIIKNCYINKLQKGTSKVSIDEQGYLAIETPTTHPQHTYIYLQYFNKYIYNPLCL